MGEAAATRVSVVDAGILSAVLTPHPSSVQHLRSLTTLGELQVLTRLDRTSLRKDDESGLVESQRALAMSLQAQHQAESSAEEEAYRRMT